MYSGHSFVIERQHYDKKKKAGPGHPGASLTISRKHPAMDS
jgi:hypothetical protein